jgi:hypothetical protein
MQLTNSLLLLSSAASSVMATVHVVQVSVNAGLTYDPSSITAAIGDTVEFDFLNGVSFFFFFLYVVFFSGERWGWEGERQ